MSVASGFVKGMVQIGAGMSEDGEAVVMLGWNAETAAEMDDVRDKNVPRKPAKSAENNKGEATSGATATPNKSTSVSDEANNFL